MAETEYSGIGFTLTADNKSALSSLDTIISRLNSLKTAVTGGGIQKGLESIGNAISNLKGMNDAEAKNIAKTANALSKLKGISISDNIAANLSAIAQAAKGITGDDIKHIDALSKAVSGFSALQGVSASAIKAAKAGKAGKVADAAKQAELPQSQVEESKDPNAIPTPGNRPSPEKPVPDEGNEKSNQTKQKSIDLSRVLANTLTNELSKAARTASSAFTDLAKSMGSFMASAGKRTWDYLTGGIRNFAGGIGNLVNQIRRVAVYRLLRTVVKDLGAALSEGIQNLYQWSLAVDQSFANAMNSISTSGAYIKNSVAAMVAPLLESLAPALDWIASKIVAVMNLINQLFSLLTGRGYWTKATKQATNFAKAATGGLGSGGAGGAAKKLKEELDLIIASFDELHLLAKEQDNNSGGGGGGGGGGGAAIPDYAGMFENVPFDERLKELIDNEDWFGLGAFFAEKLNAVTEAADRWIVDVFTPWAQKFAYAVGEIINGFVATYHWERLGETVAHGMMAIIDAMHTFYTTVDWLAVGDALGRGVRSWFETMDWIGVANYFAAKMNAAIETAKGFVLAAMRNGSDFGQAVADTIAHWFKSVKWNDLATTLIHGFNWAVDALVAWVGSNEMWDAVKRMFEQFTRAINGMDIEGLANSLGDAFVRALDTMRESGFLNSAGAAIGRFLSALPWGEMFRAALEAAASAIAGVFSGFFEGGHGLEIAGLIAGALSLKLGEALVIEFAKEGFKNIVKTALGGGIKAGAEAGITSGLSGIGSFFSKAWKFAIGNPMLSIPGAIIGAGIHAAVSWDNEHMSAQNQKTTQQGMSNQDQYKSMFGSDPFVDSWLDPGLYASRMAKIAEENGKLVDNFNDTINEIRTTSSTGGTAISDTWSGAIAGITTGTQAGLSSIASNTASSVSGIVTGVASKMTELKNNNSNTLTQVNNDTTSKWTGIKGSAVAGASGMNTGVTGEVASLARNLSIKLTDMKTGVSTNFEGAKKDSTSKASSMRDGVSSALSSMATNAKNSSGSARSSISDNIGAARSVVQSAANALRGSMNVYLGKPSVQLPDISVTGAAKGAGLLGRVIMPQWNIMWRWFAQGGFPDSQIFMANEAGNPEMVGKIGNRPAVANNDQIVAAVSRGVAEAVAQTLGRSGNSGQPVIVNVDGKQLFDIMVSRNNETVIMTGESPLLV